MSDFHLKLFISGDSALSERARLNISKMAEHDFPAEVTIEIIDVYSNPEAAEEERILAIPTLIKKHPLPGRRVIGDLADRGLVLEALGFLPEKE